jgi:hypothetical protein
VCNKLFLEHHKLSNQKQQQLPQAMKTQKNLDKVEREQEENGLRGIEGEWLE